jgi:hypothetical protein
MILTLNKNTKQRSSQNRQLFSAFFYLVNDYVFGGQFAGAHCSEGSVKKKVKLKIENKNDKNV